MWYVVKIRGYLVLPQEGNTVNVTINYISGLLVPRERSANTYYHTCYEGVHVKYAPFKQG